MSMFIGKDSNNEPIEVAPVINPAQGTKDITTNGVYNVTNYAEAEVNVPDTGEDGLLQRLIEGTQTEDFVETKLTQIKRYMYYNTQYNNLSAVFRNVINLEQGVFYSADFKLLSFPNVISTGNQCFYSSRIETLLLPKLSRAVSSCFGNCSTPVLELPSVTEILEMAFAGVRTKRVQLLSLLTMKSTYQFYNTSLISVDLGMPSAIASKCFQGSNALKAVIIRNPNLATLSNIDAFTNSAIASETGYVYVPPELVSSYQAATNWITYANQIRPFIIAENPVDIQTKLNDSTIAVNTLIICDELDYDDGKYTLKINAGEGEII